jgi:Rieske Fe-S protein
MLAKAFAGGGGAVVVVLATGGVAGVGGYASAVPKDDLADGLAGAQLEVMVTEVVDQLQGKNAVIPAGIAPAGEEVAEAAAGEAGLEFVFDGDVIG